AASEYFRAFQPAPKPVRDPRRRCSRGLGRRNHAEPTLRPERSRRKSSRATPALVRRRSPFPAHHRRRCGRLPGVQRKEGSGTTTAARIKALLLHVQRTHGRAEADAFLLKTRLDREYLDDETRPIPLERWHAALVAFASRWGREGILGISNAVVDRETIGVWTRV